MRSPGNIDHLNRPTKPRQSKVPMPIRQQRLRVQGLNAEWSFDLVHEKCWRTLQPCTQALSKWRRAVDTLEVSEQWRRTQGHVLEIAEVDTVSECPRGE